MQIHARIRPGTAGKIGIDGHEQADRGVEKIIVAQGLAHHPFAIALFDTQKSIQTPADTTPAIVVNVLPDGGIVIVVFVLCTTAGFRQFDDIAADRFFHGACTNVDVPGLRIRPRRRALSNGEDFLNSLERHRLIGEGADRLTGTNGYEDVHDLPVVIFQCRALFTVSGRPVQGPCLE